MKKIIFITLTLAILFLSGLTYVYISILPEMAEHKTREALKIVGFDTKFMGKPRTKIGIIRYDNLALDAEPFGMIDVLEIRYNPLSLLLKSRASSITIKGFDLTGEMETNSLKSLSFPGWSMPKTLSHFAGLPTEFLSIKDAKIAFLTPEFGGVSFAYNLEAHRKKDGFEFQVSLKTGQRLFSFNAQGQGVIYPQYWSIDFELDQGKLALPYAKIKASRVNGRLNLAATKGERSKLTGELRAGGASLYAFPWKNTAATLEMQDRAFSIFAEGKSIGHEGLELSLNIEKKPYNPLTISGTLHANKISTALDYLENGKKLPFKRSLTGDFEEVQNLSLYFELDSPDAQAKDIKYEIFNTEYNLDIKGNITARSLNDYSGNISSDIIELDKLKPLFAPADPPQNIPRSGKARLSGTFLKTPDSTLETRIKLDAL